MTMRAVLQGADNRLVVSSSVPRPLPQAREVLIQVKFASINRADLLQAAGEYPPPKGASPILGVEVSGIVVKKGPDCIRSDLNEGDNVCALMEGGGYAEYAVCDERTVINYWCKGEQQVDLPTMAAVPEAFLTAYQLLFLVGQAKKGETVLLHAGASSIGQAATQIAVRRGIKVITTTRSESKCKRTLELGASAAVTIGEDGKFHEKVRAANEGKGVDVVLDPVFGGYLEENLEVLNLDGRLVVYGWMGGTKVNDSAFLSRFMVKRLALLTSTLRSRSLEYKERLIKEIATDTVAGFGAVGSMRFDVDKVFNMEEAQEAHDYMHGNKNVGKILLRID